MDKPRPCGCKGRRTCLLCEQDFDLSIQTPCVNKDNGSFIYCPSCNKAWPGWNCEDNPHPNHTGDPILYPGIFIDPEFLTEKEESNLSTAIDEMPWDLSQSGRRKQNFGPKCNFKKRKIRLGEFKGFPEFSRFVQKNFQSTSVLKNFQTIEQCSLEYDPGRGASIDPHVDDCWIWGERVVTVNLLSDSILTMTYNDKPGRYNLDCVKDYPAVLTEDGKFNIGNECYKIQVMNNDESYPVVRIPMPRRSLLVMYGAARYDWEHRVLREDIVKRRVCLAYREFTPPYLEGGEKYEESKTVTDMAKKFWNHKEKHIEGERIINKTQIV